MPIKNTAPITPRVLIWARETAHLTIDQIPKSTITPEKLRQIESGETLPTLTQLQKLARRYDRSLYTLLEKEIPQEDYRDIPFFRKEHKTDYDSPLALFLRDIQRKQDWARNYLIEEGSPELDFVGSVKIQEKTADVAKRIVARLQLPLSTQYKYSQREDFFRDLKACFEAHNIFVSITGSDTSNRSISLEQAQGFAIADTMAPFVFVNTKNTINAKAFTLLHELVHLFLNETGISEDPLNFRKPKCHEDEIENFCNAVVSEILMPEELFRTFWSKCSGSLQEKIKKTSEEFLTSQLAVCIRLWQLGFISGKEFATVFAQTKKSIEGYMEKKESKSGGNYYASMRSQNGTLLSRLAFYAYKSGEMMHTEISKLLKVKVSNFNTYFEKI